jgi:hypothetical protein
MIKKISMFSLCICLVGCGAGSGKGLDAQGLPITSAPPPSQNNEVTLSYLQKNIFGAICTNCHTGSNAPRGLRLDSEENSYAFLVNHASDEVASLMRVLPGNPDASYIVRKLEGASGIVGGRMPLGGPYLTQAQINNVRDWIANGAPRAGSGSRPTQLSHLQAQKINNQISASLHFSRPLDADSVDIKKVNVFYTNKNTSTPTPIENFDLLILDQSIEIYFSAPQSVLETLIVVLKTSAELPILDSEFKAIETNNEGGEHRYVYSFSQ